MEEHPGSGEQPEGNPWRELALRLLTDGPTGGRNESRLFTGDQPEDLSSELPIPEGMTVVGGIVRSGLRRGEPETEVLIDAPVRAEAVIETYRRLMRSKEWAGQGWTEQVWDSDEEGGFAFRTAIERATFCRSRRGPALIVGAHDREDAPTDVRLILIPAGRHTPYAPEAHKDRSMFSIIPLLTPPPGAYSVDGGGGSGTDSEHTSAVLETYLAPGEISTHYAAQLAYAGWTHTGEGSDGPLAWSAWEVPDEDGERCSGLFSVLKFSETGDTCELHVSVRLVED